LFWDLTSNQNVLIYTTYIKKVNARLYFCILRSKITEITITGQKFRRGQKFRLTPVPKSLFDFDSSRSLCDHFLSKNMGELRLDR